VFERASYFEGTSLKFLPTITKNANQLALRGRKKFKPFFVAPFFADQVNK